MVVMGLAYTLEAVPAITMPVMSEITRIMKPIIMSRPGTERFLRDCAAGRAVLRFDRYDERTRFRCLLLLPAIRAG